MRAWVIYESMYGNTRSIAGSIAQGLGRFLEVELHEVSAAPTVLHPEVGLVCIGGPTHAMGMSRPGSRADAARNKAAQGRPVISATIGQREWLAALTIPAGVKVHTVTFDTRLDRPRWLWGIRTASMDARSALAAKGLAVDERRSFLVTWENTIVPGELDRARTWGETLGQKVAVGASGLLVPPGAIARA